MATINKSPDLDNMLIHGLGGLLCCSAEMGAARMIAGVSPVLAPVATFMQLDAMSSTIGLLASVGQPAPNPTQGPAAPRPAGF